jgi:hypothetical protein
VRLRVLFEKSSEDWQPTALEIIDELSEEIDGGKWWDERVAHHQKNFGEDNLREIFIHIDSTAVEALFRTPITRGRVLPQEQ